MAILFFCYHDDFSDHPGNELLWAAMGWDEASCWWRRETAWRRSCQQRKKKICISLGLAKGEGAGRLKRKGGTERDGDLGERRLQRGKKK